MCLNDTKVERFNSILHLKQLPLQGANPHPKHQSCTSRAVRSTEGNLLRLCLVKPVAVDFQFILKAMWVNEKTYLVETKFFSKKEKRSQRRF